MAFAIFIFLGLQGLFSFCGKKTCYAFNDASYDAWFPYKTGNAIIFQNGPLKDTLSISHASKSEQTEVSGGFESRNCYPEADANGRFSKPSGRPLDYFAVECRIVDGGPPAGNLQVKGLGIGWQDIRDTGISINPNYTNTIFSKYQPSLILNGTYFTDVQTIIVTSDAALSVGGLSKLFISKTIGLIAFEEYPSGALWIKQ